MTQELPGTEIDVGGANDHFCKVDAKIRRIKETARKVKAGLPWELPGQLFKDLVTYAVSTGEHTQDNGIIRKCLS